MVSHTLSTFGKKVSIEKDTEQFDYELEEVKWNKNPKPVKQTGS